MAVTRLQARAGYVDAADLTTIDQVETGIIARINAELSVDNGGDIATCRGYQGDFEDLANPQVQPRVVVQMPAALPVFVEETCVKKTGTTWEVKRRFDILIGAKNLRQEREPHVGTTSEKGAYYIAQQVRNVLIGQSFGLDIGPMSPLRITTLVPPLRQGAGFGLYAVQMTTTAIVGVPMPDTIGTFDHIDTDHWRDPTDGSGVGDADDPDVEGTVDYT